MNITVGKSSRSFYGSVSIVNVVIIFVSFLDPFKNGNGFLYRWLIDLNRLHPTFQGGILFNDPVLIKSSSPNQLQFTTSEGRFKDISGIHIAITGGTSSDNLMDFINEENDILTLTNFFHQFLHAFFKLASDPCTLNKANNI